MKQGWSAARWLAMGLAAAGAAWGAAGCVGQRGRVARAYENPYPAVRSLAVVVFQNQSGSKALDVMALTDAFCTELQEIEGLEVVAENRVLAALTAMKLSGVSSATEAVNLAEALDVDGVIVGAATEYDPYYPPRIGLAVQLYERDGRLSGAEPEQRRMDPVALSRQGRPFAVEAAGPVRPTATVVRVIDCDRVEVMGRLKAYARDRSGRKRPGGWRSYATSRYYLRFAAHEVIGELLAAERHRVLGEARERMAQQHDELTGDAGQGDI